MSGIAISIDKISMPRQQDEEENVMIGSQLYELVKQDNIVAFKIHVQELHSVEKLVTPCGNSLLHVAVRYSSNKITAYLAEEFPSLTTGRNQHEDTILHVAAREGRTSSTIETLVNWNDSLLKMTNKEGNTPLHDAVIQGNKEIAKFLVSSDPEVAYYNNKSGRCPFCLAVENGNKNGILDDLLKTEASFPVKREDSNSLGVLPEGKSPVHAAIEQRDIDILKKIEKAKPELLCLSTKSLGNSLHYASSIGYVEGVRFLLQKFRSGADERNEEGSYPIHLACMERSIADVYVLKEFLNVIPYPNEFINKKRQNILHVAAQSGQGFLVMHILKILDKELVNGMLNAMDEDGNSPLHLATQNGKSNAVYTLVKDSRVDLSVVNNEGFTAYKIGEKQSEIALQQYEGTDEVFAEERHDQFDSNNRVHGTLQDKPADENKQDTKMASPMLDYYATMTTLSILFFYARRPKKPLWEVFTSTQGNQPRKAETARRIENLIVVAVLVAGVTFAGAIQLPQLRGNNNNSIEHHHELHSTITSSHNLITSAFGSVTPSSYLDSYLFLDVEALTTSLAAALILLWITFGGAKGEPTAVWFSSLIVLFAIYMMYGAFYGAMSIAVGGSRYRLVTIISLYMGLFLIAILTSLIITQSILPQPGGQIIEGMFWQRVYFCSFHVQYIYCFRLTNSLMSLISSIKRKSK